MRSKLNRRQLLTGGAVALGGLSSSGLGYSAAPPSPDDGATSLFGVIQDLDFARRTIYLRSDGRKEVRFTGDAVFWKWTRRVENDAFGVGDEVVARGEWRGTHFLARRLEPAYRDLRGSVLRRRDSQLTLSGTGPVLFTENTVPWGRLSSRPKPLDEIEVGDELLGTAVWDPMLKQLAAVRVGVTN
ncbi:MAG: hypothetical protein M3546_14470 [Actinomycetota bacterium]|nr:hypothetical protein [Actinomycetota bacterium]